VPVSVKLGMTIRKWAPRVSSFIPLSYNGLISRTTERKRTDRGLRYGFTSAALLIVGAVFQSPGSAPSQALDYFLLIIFWLSLPIALLGVFYSYRDRRLGSSSFLGLILNLSLAVVSAILIFGYAG